MEPNQTEPKFKLTFQYQASQKRLFQRVSRNGGTYLELKAPQCLEVGGQRSGKTTSKLVFGVENYCLKYNHCDMLVLRRTFSELDSGAIQDFFKFFPKDSGWYTFNQTLRVATFLNGSRLVFAGCVREGTLIDTARGLVPIEQVTTEDSVLTRKGYRRVLWSGMTGIKNTYRIEKTWLTADHNVYCNGDFIPLQEILCRKDSGKTVRLFIQKSSYLKASPTAAIPTRNGYGIATTSLDGGERSSVRSMLQSGRASTGQFRRDLKSIIRTKILSITNQTIWGSLAEAHIANCISPTFTQPLFSSALPAERISRPNILRSERLVPSHVEQFTYLDSCSINSEPSLPVPVYDLTVDGEHEYFANGLLVHNCVNNQERDIEKYLGQAFPFILVDECGQFSDYAWNLLYARNLVNVQCEPDEHGNLPTPSICGCTNPTGAFWTYYHTLFVKKEPWDRQEGMRRAKDGRYFVNRAGDWIECYNPDNYAYNHSTVLDNQEYIKRHPQIVAKLRALPEALMKKYLLGYMDTVEGPYFDCFNEEYHVVDLREDPEAIIWQDWQPVWAGHDWGVGHWSAAYFFTKALVKGPSGSDYKLKTVCFQEIAPESTGHTNVELADMLSAKAHYPRLPESHSQYERISGKRCKVSAIYFSHEKFSRVMEKHSPADEYSHLLRERGLPPVSRATMDRIGSAGFMYNELKLGKLVFLKTCPGIIMALPSLQRDKDNLDDVLKVDNKADDRYDACRYGLYGGLATKARPQIEKDREYAATITDPFSRWIYERKRAAMRKTAGTSFVQEAVETWTTKL